MQVGEAQLVDLLEKFSQHTQKKTTIKVTGNIYTVINSVKLCIIIVVAYYGIVLFSFHVCSLRGRDGTVMTMTSKFSAMATTQFFIYILAPRNLPLSTISQYCAYDMYDAALIMLVNHCF